MSDLEKPKFLPYKKHIMVCTGAKCAPESSPNLYQSLKARLKELGLHEGEDRIHRSQSKCLGICEGGPIVAVYPDDTWYHHVTPELLEEIIKKKLVQNEEVREKLLYEGK